MYDDVFGFSEGLACVKKNDKYGFIDKTSKEVIPLIYDDFFKFF
ncbi:MAG: WG repeat-containing protein [Bacteroidetes bacterium]|nr:WG repeat-containing protein [Bacteroidota bacterium]